MVERLRLHCQKCLTEAGPTRDIAGVLLGRLLMRADCQLSLQRFVSWAAVQLQRTDPVAIFLVPGKSRELPIQPCTRFINRQRLWTTASDC